MSGVLVGREAESGAVADLLARAESGPAGLLVEGEAGIGKTTLLAHAADQAAARGFAVLSARGAPTEVNYAYAAVADLLSGVDDPAMAGLPEMQRLALQRAQLGDVGDGRVTDERMVATAFLSVIEQLNAQAPVLLTIDDAQWLDASSKAVIGFAARRLSGRTGMLTTVRIGEPASLEAASQLQLRRPESLARVSVRPLTLGGLHALIAARMGHTLPRPIIARIHEISGGNPFFALELATRLDVAEPGGLTDLPDTLAALVRSRIGYSDDEADHDVATVLLAAASTAAPTVELIAESTELSSPRVVELLDSVESRAIVELDGNRVRFTHPLLATGVYSAATAAHRRAMHRRFAEVIDEPEIRARHLALCATGGDPATLAALDEAAESTFARGASAAAAELVELALKLGGDTPQRRLRAGEMHFRAGALAAARRNLEAGKTNAPAGMLRCTALMWLATVQAYDDDTAAAAAAFAEAADEAGDNSAARLLCLLRLSLALAMIDRLDDAMERADEAVALADHVGLASLRSQALSIWVAGKFAQGRGVDHDTLRLALELEDPHQPGTSWFRASAVSAMMSAFTGDLDRARVGMHAVHQQMRDGGTEIDAVWGPVRVAAIAVWSGRYDEATAAAQEAVERAEQMDGRLALVTAWTAAATASAYTGREADARIAAHSAIDTARAARAPQLTKRPTAILGFLEVSLGNYPEALAVLQPVLDGFNPAHGCELDNSAHLPDAIEALCALGRVEEAESLVEMLERHGAAQDRAWTLAMAARGRAQVLAARGELSAAHDALERAMTHHSRLPMPFETARTQVLFGALQRRRRHYPGATANLREALETFERLGTPLWAARAQAELDRLDRGENTLLTAAEHQVAALAAEGMSNKEVAAQLFISAKTVEMNLSRVYRKLGIRSRAGLSSALASAGFLD